MFRLKHTAPLPKDQKWVETGNAVTRQYTELRKEALFHANCRNRYEFLWGVMCPSKICSCCDFSCFQGATQAYLRGDKAAAREMSRLGRFHQDRMTQLHDEAFGLIFSTRNAGSNEAWDLIWLSVFLVD